MLFVETSQGEEVAFTTLKEAAKHVFWKAIKDKRVGIDDLDTIYLMDVDGRYKVHPEMIVEIAKREFTDVVVEETEHNSFYTKINGFCVNVLITYDRYSNKLHYHPFTDFGSLNQEKAQQQLWEMKNDTIYDQMIPIAHVWVLHGFIYHVVSLIQEAKPSNNKLIKSSRA